MEAPETRYVVRPDGRNVAYQVFGKGSLDLVFCWGFISHLDLQWTNAELVQMFERLASFSRVIVFDKVGTGLSDPIDHVPTLEERSQDITAVMDAVGSERAALFGESEAGPTAILFTTMHPQRVKALILFGSVVKGQPSDADFASSGLSGSLASAKWAEMEAVVCDWGKGRSSELLAPSIASVPALRRGFAMFERASVSPSMARGLIGLYRSIDVTDILAAVAVPTLVLHRRDDWVPVEQGRYIGAHIAGARYVELEGHDHALFLGDVDAVVEEIQRFLTGATAAPRSDRILASVLFTDIVDSTARASAIGDRAWRQLLERHHAVTKASVGASEGRIVKSTGDGVLAVFPGPARAIRCATALVEELHQLGIDIRAGIHAGECDALGDDLGGLAVHVGARIASLAGSGEVLVSSTVKELVIGSGLEFRDRGRHQLKGVPDSWQVFAVGGQSIPPVVDAAASHMTLADRFAVRVARRAPGAMRALSRLGAKGAS